MSSSRKFNSPSNFTHISRAKENYKINNVKKRDGATEGKTMTVGTDNKGEHLAFFSKDGRDQHFLPIDGACSGAPPTANLGVKDMPKYRVDLNNHL